MGVPKFKVLGHLNGKPPCVGLALRLRRLRPTASRGRFWPRRSASNPTTSPSRRTNCSTSPPLVGAPGRTLHAVATRYFRFSHETARQALHASLATPDVLGGRLVDALVAAAMLSRRDRRLWTVAIDLHNVPYYGSRDAPGVVGGQKKQGTKFFHCYATAVLIHQRRHCAVGLLTLGKGLKPHEVVKALLGQIRCRGLSVGGVVLDSGFDSGETILTLQEMNVATPSHCDARARGAIAATTASTNPAACWQLRSG